MALTPEEELELLELEEEESKSQPPSEPIPEGPTESKAKRYTRAIAKSLPIVGGIGGSFITPIAGTMAGTAAGAGVKEAILSALGDQAPTLGEVTGRVGTETAIAGALGAAGKGLGIVGKFGKKLIKTPGIEEARALGAETLENVRGMGAEELARLKEVLDDNGLTLNDVLPYLKENK